MVEIGFCHCFSLSLSLSLVVVFHLSLSLSRSSRFFLFFFVYLCLSSLSPRAMAIQAQYPSNLWFADFMNRNRQEKMESPGPPIGSDYASHTPDQKFVATLGSLPPSTSPMAFLQQSPHPQFQQYHQNQQQEKSCFMINLEDLRLPNASSNQTASSAVSSVFTGLRLSLEDQQNQMTFSSVADDLSLIFNQHQQEIEQIVRLQGEQLRRTLVGKRQKQCRALVAAVERMAAGKLSEKVSEMERVARRNVDLEQRLEQLRAESRFWQAKAHAQEAVAATLQARLDSATQAQPSRPGGEPDDAESSIPVPEPTSSFAFGFCRACGRNAVSAVLLPCRHFCVCSQCAPSLAHCPLCNAARTASIEANLS